MGGGTHSVGGPSGSTGGLTNTDFTQNLVPDNLRHLFDTTSPTGITSQPSVTHDLAYYTKQHPTLRDPFASHDHLDIQHHDAHGHAPSGNSWWGLFTKLGISAGVVVGLQRIAMPLISKVAKTMPGVGAALGLASLMGFGAAIWTGVKSLNSLWRKVRGFPEDSHGHHETATGTISHGSPVPDFIKNIGAGSTSGGGH
jgi:hypothetical protein